MDDRTLRLEEIVPEYRSRNFLVKKLFLDRLNYSLSLAGIDSRKQILDVGTGSGKLIKIMIKRGIPPEKIYAIDFNINTLNLEKKYPGVRFKVADLKDTGLPSKNFDIIFCLDVLEHIKDLDSAIAEIKRIGKRGGRLVVSIPKENFFYKLGRFIIKGTFSMESGPGSGKHYYASKQLVRILSSNFKLLRKKKIRVLGIFNFFTICVFKI